MSATAAVVLAAGASRRLGRPKQLERVGGESLMRRAAEAAIAAGCDPVLVVLGHDADRLAAEVDDLAVRVVTAGDWEEGMSASLRAGIAAVPEGAGAALLMVCDQPAVTADHLRRLLAAHAASTLPAAASAYAGVVGVPAVLDRALFAELLAVKGDTGARTVLRRDPSRVVVVPLPGGEVDVDRPGDSL